MDDKLSVQGERWGTALSPEGPILFIEILDSQGDTVCAYVNVSYEEILIALSHIKPTMN